MAHGQKFPLNSQLVTKEMVKWRNADRSYLRNDPPFFIICQPTSGWFWKLGEIKTSKPIAFPIKHDRFWDNNHGSSWVPHGFSQPHWPSRFQLWNVLWKITVWIWDFCRNFFQDEPLAVVLHSAASHRGWKAIVVVRLIAVDLGTKMMPQWVIDG